MLPNFEFKRLLGLLRIEEGGLLVVVVVLVVLVVVVLVVVVVVLLVVLVVLVVVFELIGDLVEFLVEVSPDLRC